jgi:tetratricopeptide (TPR) repeat protein
MQRRFLSVFLLMVSVVMMASAAQAQSSVLDLPRQSQHARLMQRIGITDITIDYHRPLVAGRKVWGGLVPWGQVWRAGANENTTITFTDQVTVEGKPLAKGIYGLHMIPGEKEWTVIFSRQAAAWGSFTYDEKEDALRVTVKPQTADMHEALAYDFDDVKPNAATITLRWEKVAVPFKVEVNTNEVVTASLHNQLRGLSQYTFEGWDDAANYFLQAKTNLDEALKYSDRSIQVEERFDNMMTKANVLEALNRKEEAAAVRAKAIPLGTAVQIHGYGRQLQTQGKQQQAFDLYRANMKKNPDHWTAHNEAARLACAEGKFDDAVKHMKMSVSAAPDQFKSPLEALVKRLEAKEDINR